MLRWRLPFYHLSTSLMVRFSSSKKSLDTIMALRLSKLAVLLILVGIFTFLIDLNKVIQYSEYTE